MMLRIARHTNNQLLCSSLSLTTLALVAVAAILWGPSTTRSVLGIKLQPEGREKFYWSGEQFVITCQNNNNIKNVKMRWIGPNGVDITEDRSQRVHTESAGPHGHRLIVMNASLNDDNGLYKCTLGGEGERLARETIDFTLKIYKSIDFKSTRSEYTLAANDRAMLNCMVDFDQDAQTTTVSWLRDRKPIETYNDPAYSIKQYNEQTQSSQLSIIPVNRNHNGVYTCRATAVTTQLSQIREHDIRVKIQYAPQFEQSSSVVWLERRNSTQLASMMMNQSTQNNGANSGYNTYPQGRPAYPHQQTPRHRKMQHDQYGGSNQQQQQQLQQHVQPSGGYSTERVVLTCRCQANPPASIIWTPPNRSGQQFILRKGNPPHILEQPEDIIDGDNTTSILVISYDFDPQWPYKQDVYTCLATNTLGSAEKKFSIEEGVLPPAYPVDATKNYDAKTFLFQFTILPPASQASQQQQHQSNSVVPPVDMFRIRTDLDCTENNCKNEPDDSKVSVFNARPSPPVYSKNATISHQQHQQYQQHNQQHLQYQQQQLQQQQQQQHAIGLQANQFGYDMNGGGRNHLGADQSDTSQRPFKLPQNYTVSLSMLPAGAQKLYLQAHNAVGWSPNSTYLGDYYIISGASTLYQQVVCSTSVLSVLMTVYIASYYQHHHL